jgi:hypothetical protein
LIYKFPLVEIVWDDACSESGWCYVDDTKLSPQHCYTVGFLIFESRDHILIGHTHDGEGGYVGWFQIPKRMIVSRKTLKRARKG